MKIELPDSLTCTECGACSASCPKSAITFNNKNGFYEPAIDTEKCVKCGRCREVCHVVNDETKKKPIVAYGFQSSKKNILLKSASGGAFYSIAEQFIDHGGVVYAATMEIIQSIPIISHCRISTIKDLEKGQNSKYAVSDLSVVYDEIKNDIKAGIKVLFSGLPCQVAAMTRFLGVQYSNFYTIDIFCHGNTSIFFFKEYLTYLKEKYNKNITSYVFRDKTRGVGYYQYFDIDHTKRIKLSQFQEMYWYMIQNSLINMEACYLCKYSSGFRVGDISIGDFWGVEKSQNDIVRRAAKKAYTGLGMSAVLVNSSKGQEIFDAVDGRMRFACNFDDIAQHGSAIKQPNPKPKDRDKVVSIYFKYGYKAASKYCKKKLGWQYYRILIADSKMGVTIKKIRSKYNL